MEKFRIGRVSQLSPQNDAHYRVRSDGIQSRNCLRKWAQIQRGLLCEQSADTIVRVVMWARRSDAYFWNLTVHAERAPPHNAALWK
jgi:hypothetical protein